MWWSDAASIGKLVMSQANCCLLSHKLVHQPVRSNSGTMTVTLTFFITSLGVPPTPESQQIVVYYVWSRGCYNPQFCPSVPCLSSFPAAGHARTPWSASIRRKLRSRITFVLSLLSLVSRVYPASRIVIWYFVTDFGAGGLRTLWENTHTAFSGILFSKYFAVFCG